MREKSRVVDELIDLHMDFLSAVRVTSFPSSERVMFPAPGTQWYHSLYACGQKADSCKEKGCLKNVYYCGQRTGVAPAWVSLHALLPGRPIVIQYCAINTFTVQGGLYEILTVTIQMKATDWYIPDCEVPFITGAVQGASTCNF